MMAPFLKVLGWLGPLGQRMWTVQARGELRGIAMSAEQQRAFTVYTDPRFLAENARWARHLADDGAALAKNVAAGKLGAIPTVVVSVGQRSARSPIRRAHERLVARIPGAQLEVWEATTHPLHIQQPSKLADAARAPRMRLSKSSDPASRKPQTAQGGVACRDGLRARRGPKAVLAAVPRARAR